MESPIEIYIRIAAPKDVDSFELVPSGGSLIGPGCYKVDQSVPWVFVGPEP